MQYSAEVKLTMKLYHEWQSCLANNRKETTDPKKGNKGTIYGVRMSRKGGGRLDRRAFTLFELINTKYSLGRETTSVKVAA